MKPRMRSQLTVSITLLLLGAASCSKSDKPEVSTATPQPSASSPAAQNQAPGAGAFACTLLTKEDIEAVQGEPFKDAKASVKSSAGLTHSQCYFELPTTMNSIVLTVTQRADGADARDPKQNWQEIFHQEKASAKKEEKEKEGGAPEKIDGIGDEAFWTGSNVGGALYVLKGNSYIRISIGGAGGRPEKIEKSKALAQRVLKRL